MGILHSLMLQLRNCCIYWVWSNRAVIYFLDIVTDATFFSGSMKANFENSRRRRRLIIKKRLLSRGSTKDHLFPLGFERFCAQLFQAVLTFFIVVASHETFNLKEGSSKRVVSVVYDPVLVLRTGL